MKLIIGLVGQIASGKGVLVDFLVKKYNFRVFSLSSVIHEEIKKRGLKDFNRTLLQDIGDQLRKSYGSAVLAKRAFDTIKKDSSQDYWVIDGIRNPAEIEFFKKEPNFYLIGVKAKRKIRFQRVLKRKKTWDPKTWSKFLKVDQRDFGVGQKKEGQQVGRCLAYCDYIITNNNSLTDFIQKGERLIKKILNINQKT